MICIRFRNVIQDWTWLFSPVSIKYRICGVTESTRRIFGNTVLFTGPATSNFLQKTSYQPLLSRPQTKTSEDDNQKRSQLLGIRLYDLQPSNSLVPWVSVKFKRKRLISYMQLLVNVVVEIFDDKLSCSYNNRESQNHVIKGMTHA